ncbi:phytochrome-like protein cph2 [Anaerotignum neopropionicum]|uniref:Stage 0 sporulation protein A homolog n=1 Tax=Anaerotignum neopropionicum TaxID=36847 RepID=A0A136WB84_9FIRM|nr:EAL domain-containing protein [Anaerotignum neopropionicum]KXL51777.1 phytochrome-like protein cph2 [Anaerotignum neopropionicum]
MSIKILVVDDSVTDRKIIKSLLVGYDVLLAGDGMEALRIVEDNSDIDLIILDLNMPNMDGFQVLKVLKSDERYKKIRAIILSNYDELENEIKGLQLGAVDYIRKPIHMESLKARIQIQGELLKIQQLLEEKLFEHELTFDTVLQQAPIGIAISQSNEPYSNVGNDFVSTNPSFEQITGRTNEELNHIGWAKITHPEDVEADMNSFIKLKKGEIKSYSVEKRLIKPDGSVVWVDVVVANLSMEKHKKFGYICLIHDITKRKEAEKALAESERSKSVFLSNLQGMAYRCNYDCEWTMQFVSSGCFELTGYMPENLLYNRDLSFNDLITQDYRESLWKEWEQILSKRLPFRYEYEIITAKGTRKWVLEIAQGIYNDQGEVEALEGIIIDISDRKEMENKLTYNSQHDDWTGLYNRRFLETMLTNDIKLELTEKRALISINLSTLHSLTITYGFQYSQNLIKSVADVLKPYCNDHCLLFNTYEYRFAFYMKAYKDKNELSDFCERVSSTLSSFLAVERINVGIGVLEINEGNKYDVDHLLKNLLITSEEAVHLGEEANYICFYDKKLEQRIIRREILQRELSQISVGKKENRLFLQYQPILDLHENHICGFEALARYNSDELGMVSPLEFIPIAEETKYIISIGNSIIYKACEFISRLKSIGYHAINVSINISAIQLLNKGFVEDLMNTITKMKVDPEHIILELTESVFSSKFEEINKILGRLRDYGIRCSIDDFGTGYSSLSRERELNVSCLKIDKSFIDKLLFLSAEETITGDIISLAHKLGHSVVAEGVEHEKQLKYLKAYGCDKIQGYLISKPLSEEMAIKFLEHQTEKEI